MNYAKIKRLDIANGDGIRVSLFVSGCRNHCKGCFNPETWDFNYGSLFDDNAKNLIFKELDKPYISGLSVLGGDPLEYENRTELLPFLQTVKEHYPDKSIWLYTGYLYEYVKVLEIMKYIDVLVDGRFVEELKNPGLKFRGSSNQRIINIKEGIK